MFVCTYVVSYFVITYCISLWQTNQNKVVESKKETNSERNNKWFQYFTHAIHRSTSLSIILSKWIMSSSNLWQLTKPTSAYTYAYILLYVHLSGGLFWKGHKSVFSFFLRKKIFMTNFKNTAQCFFWNCKYFFKKKHIYDKFLKYCTIYFFGIAQYFFLQKYFVFILIKI